MIAKNKRATGVQDSKSEIVKRRPQGTFFKNQKEKMACQILNPFDNKIDLNTSDGGKLFKEGIKPLDEKYDGSAEKAPYFQTKAIDASESHCWATISQITMDGQDFDVLKQPGKLTMSDLLEYTETVWSDGDINDAAMYQKHI